MSDRRHELLTRRMPPVDRKSTRLNSSHTDISYAVFCLKKNRGGGGVELGRRAAGGRAGTAGTGPAAPAPPPRLPRSHSLSASSSPSLILFFFLNDRPPPGSTPFPPRAPFRS